MTPGKSNHSLLSDSLPDDVSHEAQAAAGLTAFFAITREWGLSVDEQRRLLGNPSRSRFFEMKKGNCVSLSDDELDRLSYLVNIYAALNILYSPENQILWLKNPGRPGSLWQVQSPLSYLTSGKLMALIDVSRYLNGMRGAA
ncbi:MAG TPA: hypothetical protein VIM41_01640 [Gammaproteobacteria bacterium]